MYLLNTSTVTLSEVKSDRTPEYAILSHRWGKYEVSFQDMRDGKGIKTQGYAKLVSCCAQAAEDGWLYVWIDSCCIDKTSSAELSEAINSMFRWYEDAQVCYAYLSDVPSKREDLSAEDSAFRNSKWFTRGWTLQELLAPKTVVFFDQNWVDIGTKSSLAKVISAITGINDLVSYKSACVAQKMSWAANRDTTRVEDKAYCLMGLFGVNMPLLYGEGERAFMRLQLEILRTTDDESIFAWAEVTECTKRKIVEDFKFMIDAGLLARSPNAFEFSGDVERATFDVDRPPYSMTNKGLRIEPLLILPWLIREMMSTSSDSTQVDDNLSLMPLNCKRKCEEGHLAIYLRQSRANFTRVGASKLISLDMRREAELGLNLHESALRNRRTLHVKQLDLFGRPIGINGWDPHCISIRTQSPLQQKIPAPELYIHWPEQFSPSNEEKFALWDTDSVCGLRLVVDNNIASGFAEMRFNNDDSEAFSVMVSFRLDGCRVSLLVPHDHQSLALLASAFVSPPNNFTSVDRISKHLPSGKSVSVALKKVGNLPACNHLLDVTIGLEGHLRWPESSPE